MTQRFKVDWKGDRWRVWDDDGNKVADGSQVEIKGTCYLRNEPHPQNGASRGVLVLVGQVQQINDKVTLTSD